jgi:hypothetical protein
LANFQVKEHSRLVLQMATLESEVQASWTNQMNLKMRASQRETGREAGQ